MSYQLYYFPDACSLIVRMVLEEMGLDYQDHLLDASKNEHKTPEYLAINPRGLVPTLVDGDTPIFETSAILLHLADRHKKLIPPVGSLERAQCYQWLFCIATSLDADLTVAFYGERFVEGDPVQTGLPRKLHGRITDALDLIEQQIASHDQPTLLPGGLSVCDFYLAMLVRWAASVPVEPTLPAENIFASRPNLKKCLTELEKRPAVTRAFEREQFSESTPFTGPPNSVY